MFDIHENLKKLPQTSGVYIMKDFGERIIYVGKAVNLRLRVSSYFRESNPDHKAALIASSVSSFEYIITDTELEALIMECNLIKKHTPRYNIKLKDNKAYPYIKLTVNEAYPRVFFTRRIIKDNARYYGPYYPAQAVKETLDIIRGIWPIRGCNKVFPRDMNKARPCLNYHIGKCLAPCNSLITKENYALIVNEVIQFLSGRYDLILKRMENDMMSLSEDMRFEEAAVMRDKIAAIRKIGEKQKADITGEGEMDIVALALNENDALFYIFFIRGGKISGSDYFLVEAAKHERAELMTEFIKRFYNDTSYIPKEIILEDTTYDHELISAYLSGIKGHRVYIKTPQRGDMRRLIELARTNADMTLAQSADKIKRERERTAAALDEIKTALSLENIPLRIEAYDISNTAGFLNVSSMIVFENAQPKRADYRKFKIKTVIGQNDVACMYETLTRRLSRYLEDSGGFNILPDLILIDGGKGQVSAAAEAIKAAGLQISVCGMVKDDNHKTNSLYCNEREINIPRGCEGFKLITRIQDETHRFAIEYHRKLRANEMTRSVLDDIPGIGPKRRKALMKHFGSVENIRNADIEALSQVDGMNQKSAKAAYEFFRDANHA